jgi:hypothetical protein
VAARRAPATLDNISRRPALRLRALDSRYLRKGRPVILTGLCDGAPVRRLADLRVARAALADLPLLVGPEPLDELLHGRAAGQEDRILRFDDFVDGLATGRVRGTCIERDTPDPLLDHFPDIPYLDLGGTDDGWVSHMFMAGPGCCTHLHYDADKRHVVTYQVFGRKRYVLVDPAQTRKLAPGGPAQVCYASSLYLQHFSQEDLLAFLRYVDAWDCILEPGEALVTPSGFWHYVEYVDVAMSVTFRLPRNPYIRFLASELPATSVEVQALAACFRDEDAVGPAEAAAFRELHAAATRHHPSEAARAAALDALCVELCERLDLPVSRPPYHRADIERRDRMARGALALSPTAGAQGTPTAPTG